MGRFNPDKELRKIENNNRNRIVFAIFVLLLIITIGSTYALYQVRHTNKIVYTTVDKFVNKDIILSVKLDDKDESVNEFPTADSGYVYSHTECEKGNITDITWNEGQRSLNMNSKGPDKCTVYFVKSPFHMKSCENKPMAECLLEEGKKFPEYLAFDDPDQNGRYYGQDPANYIWFNCDDYSSPSEATCERWRIIGVMKNMTTVNEKTNEQNVEKENLIKIVRANDIGRNNWDNKDTTTGAEGAYGKNDWSTAELMNLLNPGNDNHTLDGKIANNSLYWNRDSGDCSYSNHNQTIACSFTENGLKGKDGTSPTKSMIETVIWNIGGVSSDYTTVGTSEFFYSSERGSKTYTDRPTIWSGKVGLIYPSDYGYATGGNPSGTSREECLEKELENWNNEPFKSDCFEFDWLKSNNGDSSSLTHYQAASAYIFAILADGRVTVANADQYRRIYPSLYFKSNVRVTGGNGTYDNPYTINVN